LIFDKNLLFDGKSLWKKKDPVKEKNRAKGRETREASEGKGTMQVWSLQIEGDKWKRNGRLSKFGRTTPLRFDNNYHLNSYVLSRIMF